MAYLDYTGSGVETVAHLREDGWITLMFNAFKGPPRIVRLQAPDRRAVDAQVAGDPGVFEAMGDQEIVAATQKAAYAVDPEVFVARRAYAESQRHVSVRPAPDAMTFLGALLPIRDGVACFAALTRATEACVAKGDSRSRGQIMADTLVQRVTGQTEADPAPIQVNLVMTDQALLDPMGPDQGAWVDGYGPIPASLSSFLGSDRVLIG